MIEYNYYNDCCNDSMMLYRLLFIEGLGILTGTQNSLYFELSSLAIIFRLYSKFTRSIYRDGKGQVNYLNNLRYILAEFD